MSDPITTASNPRVGGQEAWADLSSQEIVQRTRCQADCDFAPYSAAVWRECCDLILSRLGPVSITSAPTPPDQGDEEVAERIVQRLLSAKYDLRDVAGRFEAINIVREEVGRQTFAPWVRSLDDARFTENEVAPIKERLERAFYDAGGFHGQLVEYAARTALPVVLDLIASAPSPEAGAGGDLVSAIAAEIMGLGWALPEFSGDEGEEAEEHTRRHGQVQSIVEAALRTLRAAGEVRRG